MGEKLKRPGGELASRPLHFFWIVDCSGSMKGEKIGTVNHAIQSVTPDMVAEAADNPNAQVLIRTLRFATGASWVTTTPVPVEQFTWEDLSADGLTDMGAAFDLLSAQLTIPPMSERALPPVLVLLSDGQPTHEYKQQLKKLLDLPWGKKAVRIAISIGKDADDEVLAEFTGSEELVLQANNAAMLTKMIKWASTTIKQVSAPATNPGGNAGAGAGGNTDGADAGAQSGAEGSQVQGDGKAPAKGPVKLGGIPKPEPGEGEGVW